MCSAKREGQSLQCHVLPVSFSVVISRFVFRHDDEENPSDTKEEFGVDEDGDLIVTGRRPGDTLDVITIGDVLLPSSTS